MKVKAPNKTTSVLVEYFFYAVIIIQTAIAAFAYKSFLRTAQISQTGFVYLTLAYFSIFALAFVQLHRIHRARKKARAAIAAPKAEVKLLPPASPVVSAVPAVEAVTALVPVRRPIPVEAEEDPVGAADLGGDTVASPGLALGLTRAQLAVILLVFLAALKLFSWALVNVLKR